MEKYTMFMDWKNQYSENEYTTQSNLWITVPIKTRKFRYRCTSRENTWRFGQRWSDASTSQRMPRIAGEPPEARREQGTHPSLSTLRRNQPHGYLDPGHIASRTWDSTFLLFQPPGFWYPRKWMGPLVFSVKGLTCFSQHMDTNR